MKPWYLSRTIWMNALMGAAALLSGPLGHAIPPEYSALGMALVNIGLRFVTTTAVK